MQKPINFLVYLHSLGFSQKQLFKFFSEKKNYKEVYENISTSFLEKEKISYKQQENILEKYKKIHTGFIDTKLEKENIQIITYDNALYPKLLKEIANPPYIIYIK